MSVPIVAAGAVRKVDELGRVVIPANVREALAITPGAQMEVFVQGSTVILRPYQPLCALCGGHEGLVIIGDKQVCKTCRTQWKESMKRGE